MSEQLGLNLVHRPAQARTDFFVTNCNRAAVALIDRHPDWADRVQGIYGPRGSGKSHLAAVFCHAAAARHLSLDDLEQLDPTLWRGSAAWVLDGLDALSPTAERGLLHLINFTRAEQQSLLLLAARPFTHLAVQLPDLKSRLRALAAVEMRAADDALLAAIIRKLFADRQLAVSERLIAYLLGRMPRDYESVGALVARIDAAAMARKKPVTIPLVADILAEETEA